MVYCVTAIIFGLGVLMGKVFFIRKSPNDLLKEQNDLLRQILARGAPEPLLATRPLDMNEVSVSTTEAPTPEPKVFEDETPIFVPKISKATKTDVNLDTQKSKFDKSDVEKLRSSIKNKADV